jgi:acetoin utilization deacetylase AcuC-like enzyme
MITLHEKVAQLEARTATEDQIGRVHTERYIQRLQSAVDRAMEEERPVPLDSETLTSEASWDAAAGSAGAILAGIDSIAAGHVRNAFVASRPPGHHARPDGAMGFCLLNHVAIGARYIQDAGLGRRVLIVDWDVHHGNGTQETFYQDPNVFYLSLHQSPHFPGTGHEHEQGSGAGEGMTMNVPLPPGLSRPEYRARFEDALGEVQRGFDPDFILVSSGFDVLAGDPLGGQELEPDDLHGFTTQLMRWAEEVCQGRVLVALEGGYVPERVGSGTVAVIRALAGLPHQGIGAD